MTQRVTFLFLLVTFALSACSTLEPLRISSTNQVIAIEIFQGSIEGENRIGVILDRKRIDAVISFVNSRDRAWRLPLNTFPSPMVTAVFRDHANAVEAVLWFGPDWIGGKVFASKSESAKLWDLDPVELNEIRSLLKIGA